MLQGMLAQVTGTNFDIECADRLSAGLAMLSKEDFDVVLLDLSLPDAEGLDTLVSVHCQYPHVPIVVLTGLDDESVAIEAVKLGAQDYLLKGQVQGPVLARALRYAIERKGSEERIKQLNDDREKRILDLSSANKTLDTLTRQLAQARDQALEAASFKSDFVAAVSHELRTPISSIVGMIELLLKTPLSEEQREFATSVYRASHALLAGLESIVDLSKMEAGKLQLEDMDFSAVTLTEDAAEVFATAAAEKGIMLVTFIDPAIPALVKGDPARLRQVICGLVENAVQFTARGAVMVQVSPESEDDTHVTLRFAVSDTGIGMSEAVSKRLFEPVIRTDGSIVRKVVGPGLGLSICQRLVKLMGGRLGVESEEGEGSTFWFTVRLKRSESVRIGASPFLAACAKDLKDIYVLVADDNPASRKTLETYLSAAKIRCVVVPDLDSALQALNQAVAKGRPFDVAIVDLGVPGSTMELGLTIKFDAVLSKTHLILVGLKQEEVQSEELLSGDFAVFLARPVRQSRLIDAITRIMQRAAGVREPEPEPEILKQEVMPPMSAASAYGNDYVILLVEDEATQQQLLLRQLKQLGYSADVACNGRQAIEMASENSYALILMDCQMPAMDGFEATKAIREAEKSTNRHAPIVAMTASALPGDKESCLAAGMDDYLSKPLGLDQLRAMLKRWIVGESVPETEIDSANRLAAKSKSPIDLARLKQLYGNDATQEIIPLFVKEARQLLDRVQEASSTKDLQALSTVAHQLKGLCASVASEEMALYSVQLETACRQENWELAQTAASTLEELYDLVVEFVRTSLPKQ